MKNLHAELAQRKQHKLYRSRRVSESAQGPEIMVDGRKLVNFCSNDYLGLANHPAIRKAFISGVEKYGTGSGAAHLVNGHSAAHHALEAELAEFTGYPKALLFSTGYMANLGIAQALCSRGDAIFEDRLNHASLLDAGLLSGARLQRYQHLNAVELEKKLSARDKGEKLVMSDGVFSMDGDAAPINQLATVCQQQDAWLMIDDAHGFGALGENGRGSLEQQNVSTDRVPIYMATLGKALGCAGAFVAGDEDLIEYLIQTARSYIYTTASPPAVAEATRASLKVVAEESWRRKKLQQHIDQFQQGAQQLGLNLLPSATAIQPIVLGDAETALTASQKLLQQGLLITAIRPPTVPEGTARLRITLRADHQTEQIDQLLEALSTVN
ncbi:MAG: 8-amino-7-oxononanoate synthase [Gammaproteobacteria bacterium]|nr:8-amino-7-oxononanoate synthase [Gammaproteobacteria bacterium]